MNKNRFVSEFFVDTQAQNGEFSSVMRSDYTFSSFLIKYDKQISLSLKWY